MCWVHTKTTKLTHGGSAGTKPKSEKTFGKVKYVIERRSK